MDNYPDNIRDSRHSPFSPLNDNSEDDYIEATSIKIGEAMQVLVEKLFKENPDNAEVNILQAIWEAGAIDGAFYKEAEKQIKKDLKGWRMSQNTQILNYKKRGKKITASIAQKKFNCWRLSARIQELRVQGAKEGFDILTEKLGKSSFARYSLIQYNNTNVS